MAYAERRGSNWRGRYRDRRGHLHTATGPEGQKSTTSKREAERWAQRSELEIADGTWHDPRAGRQTVAAWLAEWRRTILPASDRAEATKALYRHLTLAKVEPSMGDLKLKDLRPLDVQRLMLELEEAGLSGSTRRNAYAALRGALDDAVSNGLLKDNPAVKVKRPRAESPEARHLTPAQVAQLLGAAQGSRHLRVLKLLLGTGVRRGEALALQWSGVDLDRAEVRVRGSLVRRDGQLVVSATKTAKSRRTVSLSPAMVELLRTQKAAQAAERLAAGPEWLDGDYVFTAPSGGPVDPNNLSRTVRELGEAVGLGQIGPHTLRHSYATAALLAGASVHVVSRNLGHSSATLTLDIYAHVSDQASRDSAQAVSKALGL
jgi:integrase